MLFFNNCRSSAFMDLPFSAALRSSQLFSSSVSRSLKVFM
jgi:hypothetical protein